MTRIEKRQHWQQIFERQAASGLSKSAFCQQEAISLATFYYWSKRLSDQTEPVAQAVIPVVLDDDVKRQVEPVQQEQLLLTLPNGCQLTFPATMEPARLQQYVMVLSV